MKKQKDETVKTKKKKSLIILILALILIITVNSIVAIYAWAKYVSSISGNAIAQVARWSFKVNGSSETIPDINLADTISFEHVSTNRIAPGTFGKFELELDGRGSEVGIDYYINITITDKPTNLNFYSDEHYTQKLNGADGKMKMTGTIALEDVGTPLVKTVYWNWPYETGESAADKSANDEIDTTDSIKTVTMTISVTGIQKDPNGGSTNPGDSDLEKLADVVEIGDYVNYDANSGTVKSYTPTFELTGVEQNNTFSSTDEMKWRVLSVDQSTGVVELMGVSLFIDSEEYLPAGLLVLEGERGYFNSINILNNIASVYGSGKGATGARSITQEDVNKLIGYKPETDTNININWPHYGQTYECTSGTFYATQEDITNNIITIDTTEGDAVLKLISADGTITNIGTGKVIVRDEYCEYYYFIGEHMNPDSKIYEMLFGESEWNEEQGMFTENPKFYWLASRCVVPMQDIYDNYYSLFSVRVVEEVNCRTFELVDSDGTWYGNAYCVAPVVSLKPNIQTKGQNQSGVWQLEGYEEVE